MKIDIEQSRLSKILREKFNVEDGDVIFRVFYTESDNEWEVRNDKKICDLEEMPVKESRVLYF